jgi:AcrR family transcriptional regulator
VSHEYGVTLLPVPKLWSATIEVHRDEVRQAILEAAEALVAAHGLRGVTMAGLAASAGIGRATLYRYFRDVDTVLDAWHERAIHQHLAQLHEAAHRSTSPFARLEAVLAAYGHIQQQREHGPADTRMHGARHVGRAELHVAALLRQLITECVSSGKVRSDVPPAELARFCMGALTASRAARSRPALKRLLSLIMAGLGVSARP